MYFDAFVTSTGPFFVAATVGVPHEGCSSRSVFQTVSPVSAFNAIRNESACVSHCRMTRSFQIIGELAGPHSYVGMSYAPTFTRPRSIFQRGLPSTSYAYTPCDPNHATTIRPSVAGVALAYVDLMCRLSTGGPSKATRSHAFLPVCLS